MLHFYRNLYTTEKLSDQKNTVIWKLKHRAGMVSTYVIMLATNGQDVFDICHSAVLMQDYYSKLDLYIIGIANGKREAMQLVSQIVEDIHVKTGSYENMRAYLEDKKCYK